MVSIGVPVEFVPVVIDMINLMKTTKPRYSWLAITLTLAAFACTAAGQPVGESDFAKVCAKAAKEDKLIFIEFFSYHSVESKMLRDNVLSSGQVAGLLGQKFVVLQVEQGRDIPLETRFQVRQYPTVVIAKADGTEVERVIGYRNASEFFSLMDGALSGNSDLERLQKQAADPKAGIRSHMELAEAYAKRDNRERVANEFLWVLDSGSTVEPLGYNRVFPSMLTRLASLGETYPPDMEALRERRDKAEKAIEYGSPDSITRVFMMNKFLKEARRNAEIYLKIPETSGLRQKLFVQVWQDMVEAKAYKEIVELATWRVS